MVGIVPVIMEVKKEDISGGIKAKDEIKLLSMIKLTLNVMMKANVKNPVVVGLLVQDNNIRVMSMEIKFEALYFPKEIGKVIIPLDQTDFTRILGGIPFLMEAQENRARDCEGSEGVFAAES